MRTSSSITYGVYTMSNLSVLIRASFSNTHIAAIETEVIIIRRLAGVNVENDGRLGGIIALVEIFWEL